MNQPVSHDAFYDLDGDTCLRNAAFSEFWVIPCSNIDSAMGCTPYSIVARKRLVS